MLDLEDLNQWDLIISFIMNNQSTNDLNVAHESNSGLNCMFYFMVDSILRKMQIKLYVVELVTTKNNFNACE